ncbi:MAG: C4-type zinc ribbon domain-containing protein [Spirochaetales bacterium]|jgi:predicted  nucleic acid-binding Zn-ribbon protein|nr:C4-type zinc ribbon domain-containing protein [Spirochaetales bacterium]
MIEEVFEKLRSLQDILSRKFEIETEIRDIPKTLATRTELVNRLKKSYIEKNEQYEDIKLRIKNLKERMEEAEENREKLESQMDAIKTQREYEALDKEIRDASDKELQFRKDLQKEEKVLEEMAHALEREESLIKEQEEELAGEQKNVKEESDKKRKQLTQLEKEETGIIPGLDAEMLFKFERIIRSKSGLGIVPLKRGVCSGCHMILPMQFVNDVREGKNIMFCPYCSRILFFQEDGEEVFYDEAAEGIFEMDDMDDDDSDNEFLDDEDIADDEGESDDEEDGGEEEVEDM